MSLGSLGSFCTQAITNWELLVETCRSLELVVTNTMFEHADEQLATYFDLSATPHSLINHLNFASLDFPLIPRLWRHVAHDVWSDPRASLKSHHFLPRASLDDRVAKQGRREKQRQAAAFA